MKIRFDNVDFQSKSGPNSFAKKLAIALTERGHAVNRSADPDVQLSFIMATQHAAPIVQRLDGIYFNSAQDWQNLNHPIKLTYGAAFGVIYQSSFNKMLTEKYFGQKSNSVIIHNGTDLKSIESINALQSDTLDRFEKIWCCASSWRPHKRLKENIRYFLTHSDEKTCLVVAGNNPDEFVEHDRIFYVGELDWNQLISLYKRSEVFIHLAFLDHCPNVVVDARASGCRIVCSDSGGTKEVAGLDATLVKDEEWDFSPIELYKPPALNFDNVIQNRLDSTVDINKVADSYADFLESALSL